MIRNPRPRLISADGPSDNIMHLPVGSDAEVEAARRIIAAHAVDADEAREFAGMLGVAE